MVNQMTKWGVGPKLALYSTIYCVLMFGLTMYFAPLYKITLIPNHLLVWIGVILIVMGVPFFLFSLVPVMRAFKARRLITNGVYGMCRHPVYAAWCLFFIPGLALLLNSWVFLSAAFVMYFITGAFVTKEDAYLEETFGQEYLAYNQKVPAILPYGWLKKNT